MLKLCLDYGNFPIESFFEDEMERVDPEVDPETFSVLQQSRQFQPVVAANEHERERREWMESMGSTYRPDPFDKWGRFPVNW